MKNFYKSEWKNAEKEGNTEYAENCKEMYRQIVMESLKRPYLKFHDELKAYPPLYLN